MAGDYVADDMSDMNRQSIIDDAVRLGFDAFDEIDHIHLEV